MKKISLFTLLILANFNIQPLFANQRASRAKTLVELAQALGRCLNGRPRPDAYALDAYRLTDAVSVYNAYSSPYTKKHWIDEGYIFKNEAKINPEYPIGKDSRVFVYSCRIPISALGSRSSRTEFVYSLGEIIEMRKLLEELNEQTQTELLLF